MKSYNEPELEEMRKSAMVLRQYRQATKALTAREFRKILQAYQDRGISPQERRAYQAMWRSMLAEYRQRQAGRYGL